MDENILADIPQVNEGENEILTAPFDEKDVWHAISHMEHNKAPGPDGFPAEFYQVFWELIKRDLMDLFVDFHQGRLSIFSLNFDVITLIPKKCNALKIQEYHPICLLNASFKIFTKVATNRIGAVAENVVRRTQTAFMPGRNIMDGVIILHETIHELHRKNLNGVVLKIDFEKAYDKVKWSFLQQALRMTRFSPQWC